MKKVNIPIPNNRYMKINQMCLIICSYLLISCSGETDIITENKESYLTNLASKLKAEIFEHKNYVGGRYSVLSLTNS